MTWNADWATTERTAQQRQLAAQLLLAGGGALALSGVVATFISAFAGPGKPTASLLVIPTAQGASASCVVSF